MNKGKRGRRRGGIWSQRKKMKIRRLCWNWWWTTSAFVLFNASTVLCILAYWRSNCDHSPMAVIILWRLLGGSTNVAFGRCRPMHADTSLATRYSFTVDLRAVSYPYSLSLSLSFSSPLVSFINNKPTAVTQCSPYTDRRTTQAVDISQCLPSSWEHQSSSWYVPRTPRPTDVEKETQNEVRLKLFRVFYDH